MGDYIYMSALEVNGENILNDNFDVVRSGHYSAAGIDFEYVRSIESVSATGPLVNALTVQVCIQICISL